MKKFLIIVSILIAIVLLGDFLYFQMGIYIDFNPSAPITTFVKTKGKKIYLKADKKWEEFEIKGVDMGSGEPGEWSTDFSINEDTYFKWFGEIQEMGANTLRIYTVQSAAFYKAFHKYNTKREDKGKEPLYLLHGVWVNDYVQHSHMDALDDEFRENFIEDTRTMLDVIHGKKKINLAKRAYEGSGTYRKDISQWVIGYILGVEWEADVVAYTNQLYEDMEPYKGEYVSAKEDATAFESMLAEVGDKLMEYESDRYKTQKLLAFSNWPTTDPFKYPPHTTIYFNKHSQVNVERIEITDKVVSGHFASYHIYPYHPDYLHTYELEMAENSEEKQLSDNTNMNKYLVYKLENVDAPKIDDYIKTEDYIDDKGRHNTYLAYLTAINRFHSIPVVISEFGVSTGRGMAQIDTNTGRNQGNMSESEQGQALLECYNDIKKAGCAGSCIFTWQDEWFKRTWNTMHAINLTRTPYWSDYQTNEQYFGLLSFDPGEKESVCYVDGDVSEWEKSDVVAKNKNLELSLKYDEKFIYFLVKKPSLNIEKDIIYIPVDTTPKSGSNYSSNLNVKFENDADFVIILDGKENSRIMVQERYEALRSTYGTEIYQENAYMKENVPDKNSPLFVDINLALKLTTFEARLTNTFYSQVFPTGRLKYGNANPKSKSFDSLADFCAKDDYVEIKLPWQLLNFSDPSNMEIHDDYYDGNYGIQAIEIDGIYIGVGMGTKRIPMEYKELDGWGNDVEYHERLKSSYYVIKELWSS